MHGEDRRRAAGFGMGIRDGEGIGVGMPPRHGASEDDDEKLRRLAAKVALTRLRRVPGSPGATPGESRLERVGHAVDDGRRGGMGRGIRRRTAGVARPVFVVAGRSRGVA